jgi:hypothetical protein
MRKHLYRSCRPLVISGDQSVVAVKETYRGKSGRVSLVHLISYTPTKPDKLPVHDCYYFDKHKSWISPALEQVLGRKENLLATAMALSHTGRVFAMAWPVIETILICTRDAFDEVQPTALIRGDMEAEAIEFGLAVELDVPGECLAVLCREKTSGELFIVHYRATKLYSGTEAVHWVKQDARVYLSSVSSWMTLQDTCQMAPGLTSDTGFQEVTGGG